MNADIMYSIPKKEMDMIIEKNADRLKNGLPKCSCAIEENKPSHCKQGPAFMTRMPDCGFTFIFNASVGGIDKIGECKRCGACCAMPRIDGDPYGMYHPEGKPCKHLIVIKKDG